MEDSSNGPKYEPLLRTNEATYDWWEPKPASLRKSGFSYYLDIITDLGCIVIVLPFLFLAGIAVRVDGQLVSDHQWSVIHKAMSAAVTVFPIVYTAIFARTIKSLALWKLERGTSLGFLEQLMGSRSILGALQMQWSLGIVNVAGAVLVAIAILAPIGGQSSLQLLKIKDKPQISNVQVTYLTTGSDSYSQFESGTYFQYALSPMNIMYGGSLSASVSIKNSTMDLWGNVKIPSLSRLKSPADQAGWRKVPVEPNLDKYSSLIGIPISGVSEGTNTSLTIETSYFDLSCYNISYSTSPVKTQAAGMNSNLTAANNGTYFGNSLYSFYYSIAIDRILASSYGRTWDYMNGTRHSFPQRTLLFQSVAETRDMPHTFGGLSIAYCNISTAYVEAAVNCAGLKCGVTNMRPSQQPHPDTQLVPFEFAYYLSAFAQAFQSATMLTVDHTMSSPLTALYIHDPILPLLNTYRTIVNLYKVSPRDMSIRLGQVLNSYYLASLDPWGMTGLKSSNGRDSTDDGINSGGVVANITTTSRVSVNKVFYVCMWGWWVTFVLACAVLLATASLGIFLHWQSTGPDILGYVSSLTRDSPYVSILPGGSALDGADRARLLKDLKVQLRDVRAESETGRLAFVSREQRSGPPIIDRIYE